MSRPHMVPVPAQQAPGGASARARLALATVRAHPRHVVLAALVAGLLLSRAHPAAVVATALAAATLAGATWPAPIAAAAVLLGATLADARLTALDAGVLADMHGRSVTTRVVVLEPVRERAHGPAVARVRLLDGPGAGEQAVLRSRAWPGPPRAAREGGSTAAPAPGTTGGGATAGATLGGGATAGVAAGGEAAAGVGAAAGGGVTADEATGGEAKHGAGPSVAVGDIVAVSGRVAPLGFADAYQRLRNAHAAIDASRVDATGTRRGGVAGVLDGVRRRAEAGLAQRLAAPEAALLRGMVIGADEQLTGEVKDDFQRSGLAHILAVSGQNVMLLAILVLAVASLLGLPLRARLVVAALAIALYVPLTGAGPSIQRAGVMGITGLVAALAGRPAQRWYALLLAAAVTLVLNPRSVQEPGWQLSFAAVAALLAGFAPLAEPLKRRLPDPVAEAAALTLAATIGTAPLMAMHFEEVSLAALPANLLAAPAIAPVMWLGVLACAAAQLAAPLAVPFTFLTAPLLVYVQHVARITAATPLSVVEIHASPQLVLAGWLGLVLLTALALKRWSRTPRRRRRVTPAAAALALAVVAAVVVLSRTTTAPPAPGVLRVTFLDIGQGDATLIEHDGVTVLIDTGKPDGPILTRLREAGVDRLDALMLTHAETDHEGAAPAVIAKYRPRLIVDGGAGWSSAVQRTLTRHKVHAPAAGETITLNHLRFHVLWPPRRPAGWTASGDPNDNALVMRLEAEDVSVFLTADAESPVLSRLALAPVDVLKVPHHGSADPGLPALLQQLQPKVAAIEVGKENTYGHPDPSTTRALAAAVPTVVRTDTDGTVRLHADDGRLAIQR
ncbi:DNA internalization-related competence protein ComEC/Rec2 [Solirubrobacter phytolaccae]|uniref:DNA internalization-related competence protein ComEC/Rec2 n=1 Tax=Solirubrobacter phytolaccae TaxID=1404360 RepID=A0A9X3ND15_9ACTN|nr:DNA internalization-related competence protein ComEC/Rec2 [Solirubrobacter phytolaccae]MDA0181781.1 DNA internalization-related competence protein ComEC/Rec2 [Solirubrobacter phytolaccae]